MAHHFSSSSISLIKSTSQSASTLCVSFTVTVCSSTANNNNNNSNCKTVCHFYTFGGNKTRQAFYSVSVRQCVHTHSRHDSLQKQNQPPPHFPFLSSPWPLTYSLTHAITLNLSPFPPALADSGRQWRSGSSKAAVSSSFAILASCLLQCVLEAEEEQASALAVNLLAVSQPASQHSFSLALHLAALHFILFYLLSLAA